MTIRESLITAIADLTEQLSSEVAGLLTARHTGQGGQIWAEFKKIFLSLREEAADYNDPLTSDPVSIGMILAIEKDLLNIHQKRGSNLGLIPDIKRLCNSTAISVAHHGQLECGWINGETSPGFYTGLTYNPELSLSYLGLDNMLDITIDNQSGRGDAEVKAIIRKEFVPLKENCRYV